MNGAARPRGCPVCGSQAKEMLFRQQFAPVGPVAGYAVVVCEQCGFAFADGIPSRAGFERCYRELSKYEYQQRAERESPVRAVFRKAEPSLKFECDAAGRLDGANISAFVDSNPRYQGREVRGIPVVAPEALRQRTEPILIGSRVFQSEIGRQIREQPGLANELLTLDSSQEAM